VLEQLKFFKDIEPALLKEIETHAQAQNQSKGDYLFYEGDLPDYFYGILSGRVYVLRQSPAGKEVVLNVLEPGDMVGLVAYANQSPYSATAMVGLDSKIVRIPASAFHLLVKDNMALKDRLLRLIAGRLKEARCMMMTLSIDNVESRVASVVWKEILHRHIDELKTQTHIQLDFTRQNLADMSGTTVESTIRLFKVWEKKKIVSFPARGSVKILNLVKIKQLSAVAQTMCCQYKFDQLGIDADSLKTKVLALKK
jgi:CRP/FNR family transcriptional regulator